ncbi:MAG: hypothetical protein WDN76_10450 [Alphaproteobacteria bacterium]
MWPTLVRPANEFEHFIVCPKCRQAVDCADIAEVMRHADPLHKGAV